MSSQAEKLVNYILIGLAPPMPVELKAEFHEASLAQQHEARRDYLWGVYRWAWILSLVVLLMIIKWAWECGLLVWLGLSAGFAQAGEVSGVTKDIAALSQQQAQFQQLYKRDQLLARLRDVDKELFEINVAIRTAEKANKTPDPLHINRLRQLTSDREELLRSLSQPTSS